MNVLGTGLFQAGHHEDALTVREAELATMRRLGAAEESILIVKNNLANSYATMGRLEQASQMERDIYRGRLKLNGEEHVNTLISALNSAATLVDLKRFEEAKSLLRRTLPVARRALGKDDITTLGLESIYAEALYRDPGATLDDLREAVTSLEDAGRRARRVLSGAHPLAFDFGQHLRRSRAALRARETPPPRHA